MKKSLLLSLLIFLLLPGLALGVDVTDPAVVQKGYGEGYFIRAEGNRVLIEDYGGDLQYIIMDEFARKEIDTRPVELENFKAGMEVYIEIRGRKGVYIDAFSTTNPGYVIPGRTKVVGRVKAIDRNHIQLVLPTGEEKSYYLSPATIITRNKKTAKASSLYVGDSVKLFFENNLTSEISRMEIEGDSIKIKDIYRGKMEVIDKFSETISFQKLERFKNDNWEERADGLRLSIEASSPIYRAGSPVKDSQLNYFRGETAYMVVKDDFGREKVERMLVKNQYENRFSDKIKDVNWFSSQIELANNQNININPGTIIIKNGRLVDMKSLNPNSDALIIADGLGGSLTASIINIYNEDLNNSNLGQDMIYSGRLDRIFENKLSLRDFFLLEKNQWESFAGEKEIYFDEESKIYDLDKKREISKEEFYSGNFAVDEDNKDNRHDRDHYAYIYSQGDRGAVILVKERMDSLLKQRVTTGTVELPVMEDAFVGPRLKLRDSKDWSRAHEEWMAKKASIYLYLKDAVLIKNGEKIGLDEIKPGDSLYLIREDNMAKIIIVK